MHEYLETRQPAQTEMSAFHSRFPLFTSAHQQTSAHSSSPGGDAVLHWTFPTAAPPSARASRGQEGRQLPPVAHWAPVHAAPGWILDFSFLNYFNPSARELKKTKQTRVKDVKAQPAARKRVWDWRGRERRAGGGASLPKHTPPLSRSCKVKDLLLIDEEVKGPLGA